MDDNEKIKKASEILEKHDVGKNLTFLIDSSYKRDVEGVEWNVSVKPSSILRCYKFHTFKYGGRHFEIAAVNTRPTYGGDEDWSDLTLKVDGDVVLTTILATTHGEWSVHNVDISSTLLKQVKLGNWMNDLTVVCQRLRDGWEEVKKQMEREAVARRASEIDLGEYE